MSDTATSTEPALGTGAQPETEVRLRTQDEQVSRPWPAVPAYLLAFAAYLGLSFAQWWHVWAGHPSSTTLCGCEDPSLTTWFIAWPAYALSHGLDPLYSGAQFHPVGINLVSNTGMLALGVPLTPVTLLFGPVASFNVAGTLGPALSALAGFFLLRRWVTFVPAAFAAGLVFGFSPFVVDNLAVGHFNLCMLGIVALMIASLDELLFSQRRSAPAVGVALALLVTVQFFLGDEILVMFAMLAGIVIVLVACWAALRRPVELRERVPHAVRGLVTAAVVAAVLLAYPVWFALDGPAHLGARVWPTIAPGSGGLRLRDLWDIGFTKRDATRFFAGYQGAALPNQAYVGIALLVVLGAGTVVWWRDRKLQLFGVLGIVAAFLALGNEPGNWTPWRMIARAPLIVNMIPGRIDVAVTIAAAVMLAVVSDRTYALVRARFLRPISALPAVLAGLGVLVAAELPMASAIAGEIPLAMQPVSLPTWFATVGKTLPAGRVVLTYPPPATGGEALTWQAVDGMRYAIATGAGPQAIARRAGSEAAGFLVLTRASALFPVYAQPTVPNVTAVRQAVAGWGVTDVVVPEPAQVVPHYDRDPTTSWALAFFTLAIGRPPSYEHDALVWTGLRRLSPVRSMTAAAFARCSAPPAYPQGFLASVPPCVMSNSSAGA